MPSARFRNGYLSLAGGGAGRAAPAGLCGAQHAGHAQDPEEGASD